MKTKIYTITHNVKNKRVRILKINGIHLRFLNEQILQFRLDFHSNRCQNCIRSLRNVELDIFG